MDTQVCLNTLMELAYDTGNEIREIEGAEDTSLVPAKIVRDSFGNPTLIVNREFSVEERVKSISRCLQCDPQLANYALSEQEETALRTADSLVLPETDYVLSIKDYQTAPQPIGIRRAA